PALRRPRLPAAHRHAQPARPGRPLGPAAARPRRDLLPAPLPAVRGSLQRPHGRPRPAQEPLHPPRRRHRRPPGRGRRPSLSLRQLPPVAGPPPLRPLRHGTDLRRRRGGKKASNASPLTTSTAPCPTSPATSPPTSCTTAPFVCCRSWTTGRRSGC